MATKAVSSTDFQNHFGQLLDDVVQNGTRYLITRRGLPGAIVLSLSDFEMLLKDEHERIRMQGIVRDHRPSYNLGQPIICD